NHHPYMIIQSLVSLSIGWPMLDQPAWPGLADCQGWAGWLAGFLWESRSFNKDELITADEVFLTSTPWCILAAVQIDGQPVGKGVPGPIYHEFLNAWSKNVGVDIADQAHFGKTSQTFS
ncbi:MAG: hypothetical protein QGI29_01345, partial [Pirellulales bacterium]|nr:hypothetical protein [Pirellulales bacterium]